MLVSTVFDRNFFFFFMILLGYKLFFKIPSYFFSYFNLHAFLLVLLLQHFLCRLHNFSHFCEWFSKMQEKIAVKVTFCELWVKRCTYSWSLLCSMLRHFRLKKIDSNKKSIGLKYDQKVVECDSNFTVFCFEFNRIEHI